MKTIISIIWLSSQKKFALFFAVLTGLLHFSNIVYPYLYGLFFDSLDNNTSEYLSYLKIIAMYLSLYFVLDLIFSTLTIIYRKKLSGDLTIKITHRILKLDKDEIHKKGAGYFTSIIDQSLFCIVNILQPQNASAFFSIIKAIVILAILFSVDIYIALIMLFWLVIYTVLFSFAKKYGEKCYSQLMDAVGENSSLLINRLRISQLTKVYKEIKNSFIKDITNSIAKLSQKRIADEIHYSIYIPIIAFKIEPFFRVAILFLLGHRYYNGYISLGTFVESITYFLLIMSDISNLSTLFDTYILAKTSSEKVHKFLVETQASKMIAMPPAANKFVELKGFSFKINRYAEHSPEIDITLPNNKIYALTGDNGFGKSSFIKIINSQLDEYKGKVLIGGLDIQKYQVDINYIAQDDMLIEDYSLRDNITMKAEIDNLYLHTIIRELKIEDLVKRDNFAIAKLSGGEKRKIILARFLYHIKNIQYFILDEVFISLDRDYMLYVLPIIKKYITNKTGIIVSHNPIVIKNLCNSNDLDRLFQNLTDCAGSL